jgi:hypothetical protein
MKLSYIVLQIALVGAGILVYDQVRGGQEPAAPVIAGLDTPRGQPASAPEIEVMAPVVLEGKGMDAVVDRLVALEQRVAGLTERTTVVGDSGYPAGRPAAPEIAAEGTAERAANPESGYAQAEIDWFRGLKKEADQIERRERYASMINRQLNRADVDLTDEQRGRIVDSTIAFRNRMRDEMRQAQERGDDRDARQTLIDGIRTEYEQTVYSLLPVGDAEKVIESVGRYSGFGSRRVGSQDRFQRR